MQNKDMCAVWGPEQLTVEVGSGSDSDPDYVPTDDESQEWFDSIDSPRMLDRCHYIRLHREVLDQLYCDMVARGRDALGDAFMQHCTPERFYTFAYCNTQIFQEMN